MCNDLENFQCEAVVREKHFILFLVWLWCLLVHLIFLLIHLNQQREEGDGEAKMGKYCNRRLR